MSDVPPSRRRITTVRTGDGHLNSLPQNHWENPAQAWHEYAGGSADLFNATRKSLESVEHKNGLTAWRDRHPGRPMVERAILFWNKAIPHNRSSFKRKPVTKRRAHVKSRSLSERKKCDLAESAPEDGHASFKVKRRLKSVTWTGETEPRDPCEMKSGVTP